MKILYALPLCSLLALVGCSHPGPRSKQYFDVHLDEARRIVAGCRDGSVTGSECDNADIALQEAEARERRARFFGSKPYS